MPVTVHIYPLSRLVHATAGSWETQLRTLEEGKLHAYRYYFPLREAAVAYCISRGERHDPIVRRLTLTASRVPAASGANPVKDNLDAFNRFITAFYPRIGEFSQSLLREDAKQGCRFENIQLDGMPHFTARDAGGKLRYVYLHASKWDENSLKAYLELLAIIIRDRFDATPESIWCMDLRTGKDYKWKSSPAMKKKCINAARLYARFIEAMRKPE